MVGYARSISCNFMKDLKTGVLACLLARVNEDDTLMLALRGDYVNVYYRGGSLLKISKHSMKPSEPQSTYCVHFDENFYRECASLRVDFPSRVSDEADTKRLVEAIPNLKYAMDRFFKENSRPEREFQQLVARENNLSRIANETEYFIVDIEVAGALPKAKFDMLAVRWLSNERNQPAALVPALIEMKYANGALDGESGLVKHLKDAYSLRRDEASWQMLRTGLANHLKQLDELDQLRFNRSTAVPDLLLDPKGTPELIFLLENYNPRSTKLFDIRSKFDAYLNSEDPQDSQERLFDVRFFQGSFAGYGMHHASMLKPHDFKELLQKLHAAARPRRPGCSPPRA